VTELLSDLVFSYVSYTDDTILAVFAESVEFYAIIDRGTSTFLSSPFPVGKGICIFKYDV
jgi:hypothetical protein